MATINYSLSQAAVNTITSLNTQDPGQDTLSNLVDALIKVNYEIDATHFTYSYASMVGSSAYIYYPDGAWRIYSGIYVPYYGTVSATGMTYQSPYVTIQETGSYIGTYQATSSSNITSFSVDNTILSSFSFSTNFPSTSPYYDTTYGNQTITLIGNLVIDQYENISGTISSISIVADHFASSMTIAGNFSVSGNLIQIGESHSSTILSGHVTNYIQNYYDGSRVEFYATSPASTAMTGTQSFPEILVDPSQYSGDDTISINLPTNMSGWFGLATYLDSGAGNDSLSLTGATSLNLNAGSGNDSVTLGDTGHSVIGGSGIDTLVLAGSIAGYGFQKQSDGGWLISSSVGAANLISGFEFIQFSTATVNLYSNPIDNIIVNTNSATTIQGTDYNDYIVCLGSTNTIMASQGSDTIVASPGNGINTLRINLTQSALESISSTPDGGYLIRTSLGTNTLKNIQYIAFDDLTTSLSSLASSHGATPYYSQSINGVTAYKLPTVFVGDPSLNLNYEYIDDGEDAVVTASADNEFICLTNTSSVGKAINGNGGSDVINAGVGSNFISGGLSHAGSTFFLDGRASGVSWSTITDFDMNNGDSLTIWGWNPGVSSLNNNNTEIAGAPGYTGLTLYFNNLAPDGSGSYYVNPSLNQVTFSNHTLSEFGFSSIINLNSELQNLSTQALNNSGANVVGDHIAMNSHFTVGQTIDVLGTHWYLNIH